MLYYFAGILNGNEDSETPLKGTAVGEFINSPNKVVRIPVKRESLSVLVYIWKTI